MTTLVRSVSQTYEYEEQGTGFFYDEVADQLIGSEMKECDWLLNGQWLITNRHVAFPKHELEDGSEIETVPDYFEFNLRDRKTTKDGKKITNWHPIRLTKDELLRRTRLHPNPVVDVVAVEIEDLLISHYSAPKFNKVNRALTLNADFLPERFKMDIQVTSDVVVCSYPFEVYDKANKFPIIKSGIVASMWGENFENDPCFLIDAQLFPGSSGGLVLSKPSDMVTMEGDIPKSMLVLNKWFVLLGVFSHTISETLLYDDGSEEKKDLGLGVVWYSYLIPEIIKNGVKYGNTSV